MARNLGINIKIGADLKQFSTDMQNAQRQMRRTSRKFKQMGSSMTRSLTLPLGLMGGAMIKFASDTQESLNKVDVAFGDSSKSVQEFSKTTLKSFGIARGSALDMAATFGDMGTSMGLSQDRAAEMSMKLVGLAGDLASFKNIRIDVAQTALTSIFTGETESLKKLGVVMTQANLSAFALEQGITKPIKAMSEGEKTMLRYQYVMAKTANAHGDFERTGGGAANQMRIFQEGLKELGDTFGQIVLPMFTNVVQKANQLVQWFGSLNESTKKVILAVGGLVAVLGPVVYGLGTFIESLTKLGITMGETKQGLTIFLKNPIMLTLGAVAALTAGIIALGKHIDNNHPILKKTREVTSDLADANSNLKEAIDEVNQATSTGVGIDNAARESMLKKTGAIINETIAKIENARATRNQLIEEKKLQLERTLSATRGVGQQGEFIGAELGTVKALEKSIEELNVGLAESDKLLRDAYASYLKLQSGDLEKVNIKDFVLGDSGGDVGRAMTSTVVSMDAVGLSTEKWAKSLQKVKDSVKELKPELKNIEPVIDSVGKYAQMMAERWQSTMESMKQGLEGLITDTIADFFSTLGSMFAGGENDMKGFGKRFLSAFGGFLGDFGKMLIAFGVAKLALFKSLSAGPAGAVTAIAAGAALVAIGGAISTLMKDGEDGFNTGSPSPYIPSTSSGSGYNFGSTNDILTLETVVYGRDIVLSSNRQHGTISRTRRK